MTIRDAYSARRETIEKLTQSIEDLIELSVYFGRNTASKHIPDEALANEVKRKLFALGYDAKYGKGNILYVKW